jgi:hypothetical protein
VTKRIDWDPSTPAAGKSSVTCRPKSRGGATSGKAPDADHARVVSQSTHADHEQAANQCTHADHEQAANQCTHADHARPRRKKRFVEIFPEFKSGELLGAFYGLLITLIVVAMIIAHAHLNLAPLVSGKIPWWESITVGGGASLLIALAKRLIRWRRAKRNVTDQQ